MTDPGVLAQPARVNLGPLTRDEFVQLIETIRDQHACAPSQTGRSNRERSHKRRVTTLSYWIRHVAGIRSIDIDQVAYCPRCQTPLAWMETKPYNNPDEWSYVRALARRTGSYAILGVEPDQRIQHFDAIWIYPEDPRC